jgi:GT2 family glycosyltransferase
MTNPLVSVVIPNFKEWDQLSDCVESLLNQSYANTEIIVVNEITDAPRESGFRRRFPKVELVAFGQDSFIGATNCGLALSRGDYVLFDLDCDRIFDKDYLKEMVRFLEDNPQIGTATGPVRLMAGGSDLYGSVLIESIMLFLPNRVRAANKQFDITYLQFARRTVLARIGNLDEAYFLYFEDTDFSYRARKAGFGLGFCPAAVSYHLGSATIGRYSARKAYLLKRNRIRFIVKLLPISKLLSSLVWCTFVAPLLDMILLMKRSAVGQVTKDSRGIALAVIRGTFDGIKGLPRFMIERSRQSGDSPKGPKTVRGKSVQPRSWSFVTDLPLEDAS